MARNNKPQISLIRDETSDVRVNADALGMAYRVSEALSRRNDGDPEIQEEARALYSTIERFYASLLEEARNDQREKQKT